MTVASAYDPRIQHAGAGSTGPFTTPRFLEEADLLVTKTDTSGSDSTLTLTTDYTISGGGSGTAGNLTLTSALAVGETLTIVNDPDDTQTADYTANDPFPSATHETALDRRTYVSLRQKDRIDRCFQLAESVADPSSPITLDLANNLSKPVYSNATGDGLTFGEQLASEITVTGTQADGAVIEGDSGSTASWKLGRTWKKGADVASASELTLGTDGNAFDVTGTTTITSIASLGVDSVVLLQFDGVLQLTHHSTDLVLPSATNITTAAGDTAIFHEYASGDWRLVAGTLAGSFNTASVSDVNTGTSTSKGVTPDALAGSYAGTASIAIEVFAATDDVTTGDGAAYFPVPAAMNGMDLVSVAGYHVTAGTGAGSDTTDIQIHNVTDAADMLSTKLTIDEDETSSATAATAAVIDTSNDDVATGDMLRVDVDALVSGTAPQGLFVVLEFRLP